MAESAAEALADQGVILYSLPFVKARGIIGQTLLGDLLRLIGTYWASLVLYSILGPGAVHSSLQVPSRRRPGPFHWNEPCNLWAASLPFQLFVRPLLFNHFLISVEVARRSATMRRSRFSKRTLD